MSKAGTSEYGVCGECGKPYARILRQNIINIRPPEKGRLANAIEELGNRNLRQDFEEIGYQTLDWKAQCKCKTDKVVGATVLDPFCGTGTTLYVASKLGRQARGYELSEDYCKLTVERLKQAVLL